MSPQNFKIKIKQGTAEFEAEGSQQFVEKHLKAFKPLLNLAETKTAKPRRKPGRKPRKARKAKSSVQPYPPDAIAALKAFIAKAKPKGQPATAVALGTHHLKHFKTPSFKNQDILAAAKAVGFKFTNLALSLRAAAQQGKIRKVKKGTWRLANPTAKPVKNAPAKKRRLAKPKPVGKPSKPATVKKPARAKKSGPAKKPVPAKKPEAVKPPTPPAALDKPSA